jgi:MoaA/NifB/PqqE/SkfB family radical SAM enzyme
MFRRLSDLLPHRSKRPYRRIQVEPALECNLSCALCPWAESRSGHGIMAWDTFSHLAPSFRLVQTVDFTGGGEPTLNGELPAMLLVAKELGCEVGFSTNGMLLNADLAADLVGVGVDWVNFSVDGASAPVYEGIRGKGDFGLVAQNIEGMRDTRARRRAITPRLTLVFALLAENLHELPALVDLAHGWGVSHIVVRNLDVIRHDSGDSRRIFAHPETVHIDRGGHLSAMERAIAESQRRAMRHGIVLRVYALQPSELAVCEPDPLNNLFVDWAGNVSPCITLSHATQRVLDGQRHYVPTLRLGNVNEDPLEVIWDRPAYRELRAIWEARLRWEREAVYTAMTGVEGRDLGEIPPAPEGCVYCYYLYGV